MTAIEGIAPVVEPVLVKRDHGGSRVIVFRVGDEYFRLVDPTPEFKPVDRADRMTRPTTFSSAFLDMHEANARSHQRQAFGWLSLEDTILLFFMEQLMALEPNEVLRFADANDAALSRSGKHAPHPNDAAAQYRWAKASAAAWPKLRWWLTA